MTRKNDKSSTTDFKLFDDHVFANDSFINVRDMQALIRNHNALYGRNIRRSIVQHLFAVDDDYMGQDFYGIRSHSGHGTLLFSQRILVNQGVSQLKVKMRATTTGAAGPANDAYVSAVCAPPGRPDRNPYAGTATDQTVTISAAAVTAPASATTYSMTVSIPVDGVPDSFFGKREYDLSLFLYGEINTTAAHSAKTLTDFEDDWAEYTSSSTNTSVGNAVRNEVTGEVVLATYVSGGRIYIDRPWSVPPRSSGTAHTMAIHATVGVRLFSLSVYEIPSTNTSEASQWLL